GETSRAARGGRSPVKRKRGDSLSPSFDWLVSFLFGRVQFHPVARVHIFQREDHHGGRRGWSYAHYYHFSHRAARQIAHTNVHPFGPVEAAGLNRRRTHLRVF